MNNVARIVCPLCEEGMERPPLAEQVTCPRCGVALDVAEMATARGRPRFVAQADLAGQSIGPYRLVERLGSGGTGTVYRAQNADDSAVAIKVLDPSLARDEAARERFRREAVLLADLVHPRIVRLRDRGECEGLPWLAMEFVEGTDLRARLRRGRLDPAEAAALFAGLLDGLSYAHGRGVVHRDIKPGNILLGADGPRIADFGIARIAGGPSGAAYLTATEAVLGTLLYMAPEQQSGAAVDARADLYSVGVVLYEALTGKLPQGAFAPPSKVSRRIPARIDAVVMKLLQPDPAARYATADEAAKAIARALAPRGRARVFAAASGAAIAVVAASAWLFAARPAAVSVAPPPPPVSVEKTKSVAAPAAPQASPSATKPVEVEKTSLPPASTRLAESGREPSPAERKPAPGAGKKNKKRETRPSKIARSPKPVPATKSLSVPVGKASKKTGAFEPLDSP